MASVTVSALVVYPLKSARGIALDAATVSARGLDGDRRWMVVDSERTFMTQRAHPRLALIGVAAVGSELLLAGPGMPDLTVARPTAATPGVTVRVWDDACDALPAGDAAARWLSQVLEVGCELVYLPDRSHRAVAPLTGVPAAEVGFADAYPFLLLSEASLEDLNRRLARPVPMDRFRPNLVVRGCGAFAEDGWRRIRIGPVVFHVVKPCRRCSTTTVDQATAERGREPLATLASYRMVGGNVTFGQNLVHEGAATIRVGEEVVVLDPA